jgi:hypothetical protein
VAAGSLNFAAGQNSASFTISALSDMMLESPETVNLVLSGGNVSNQSILTINDVPPTPTPTPTPTPVGNTYFFSAGTYTANEGSSAPITINRSGNLSQQGTITFLTVDGSAQATGPQADYSSVFLTVNFPAGQSSVQVPVQTLFDTLSEPPETVNLFLSGSSVASPSLAVLSIIDPSFVPSAPFFSYASPTLFVFDSTADDIIINRTGDTWGSASIDYLIVPPAPGQPTNFTDYIITDPFPMSSSGGTVNFNPGQTSATLRIVNYSGRTSGQVVLGFGPGTNIGTQPFTIITLL